MLRIRIGLKILVFRAEEVEQVVYASRLHHRIELTLQDQSRDMNQRSCIFPVELGPANFKDIINAYLVVRERII